MKTPTSKSKFAAAIAWLASPENPDSELRELSKGILDRLCALDQLKKKGIAK